MNQLSSLLELPTPPIEESARIFSALAVYVLDQFTYEEQRMASIGYPANELAEHKATHLGFSDKSATSRNASTRATTRHWAISCRFCKAPR